ncbi:uncharacterized protein LOC129584106 [Paramacrobiotus metropolitanus]|uniref:uncharacterized protein LOC129584106 n=1 Tax=Paramacrobiotus metropolitanus TaxID=2943436 RepID=UPI002445EA97|nr:uncharacterized protein LOC129584106 [Paramacrobiotus metropolitanus]
MSLIAIAIALSLTTLRISALNVTIVSLQTGDPGVAIGLPWTGAALQIAVQHVDRYYAQQGLDVQVSLKQINALAGHSCITGPTVANNLLAQFYYGAARSDVCYGLISNGCADFPQVTSLAAEWDWLVFNNGASDPTTKNVLNTAGTMDALGTATLSVIRHFRWQHVTVLADTDPKMTILYARMALAFIQRAKKAGNSLELDIAYSEFSGLQNSTIQKALQMAIGRSRGTD